MAKIPIYTRQNQLSTQAPDIEKDARSYGAVSGARAGLGGTIAQAGAQVADTANDLYGKFEQAKNYHEELRFDLQTIEGFNGLSDKAAQDPNIEDNLQKYENEGNSILSEAAKGISSNELRDKIMLKGKIKLASVGASLRDLGRKSIISKGQANTIALVDQYANEYAATGDETVLTDMQSVIESARQKGFYDEKQSYELGKKATQEASYLRFQVDLAADRKQAEENLKSDKYNMDVETKLKAEAKIKVNTQEIKAAQIETRGLGNEMLVSGELTEGWIDEQVNLNKSDPMMGFTQKDGLSLKKALYGDIKQRVTSLSSANKTVAKYKKAIDTVFSSNYQDQLRAYDAVLDAYSDGAISKDEMSFFNSLIKTQKDINWSAKSGLFQSTINTVKNIFGASAYASDDSVNAIRNMMLKIQAGKEPTIAAKEIVKEKIQQDHPGAVIDDKIPPTMYGKGGFDNTIPTSAQTKSAFVYSKAKGFKEKGKE